MKKKELKKIATKKQINMIAFIKEQCDIKFKGKTSKDVYQFIGEWYPKALKMEKVACAIGKIGVMTYQATKTYYGNDVHGTWEETRDLWDTIAHDRFERELVHGRNPVDALCDFQERAIIETICNEQGLRYDYN